MSRHVAITGATGFVGRHLVARHVALGDTVRYLTRNANFPALPGAIRHIGDLVRNGDSLHEFVEGVDVLYHCAAELLDVSRMDATNVTGTRNLLRAAQGKVGRWVQLSSTGVYGAQRGGTVDEQLAINPSNAYECSKAAADALVLELADRGSLDCVVLRPSNVYGAHMRNRSLFQLIRMIDMGVFFYIGPPGAMANYIHVENVVDALLEVGRAELPQNGRIYIVSDYCTLEAFVEQMAECMGCPSPHLRIPLPLARMAARMFESIPGFPLKSSRVAALTDRTIYQYDRISRELGYCNRITLAQGVHELVRAWKSVKH